MATTAPGAQPATTVAPTVAAKVAPKVAQGVKRALDKVLPEKCCSCGPNMPATSPVAQPGRSPYAQPTPTKAPPIGPRMRQAINRHAANAKGHVKRMWNSIIGTL